jgi:hypothetical protein
MALLPPSPLLLFLRLENPPPLLESPDTSSAPFSVADAAEAAPSGSRPLLSRNLEAVRREGRRQILRSFCAETLTQHQIQFGIDKVVQVRMVSCRVGMDLRDREAGQKLRGFSA